MKQIKYISLNSNSFIIKGIFLLCLFCLQFVVAQEQNGEIKSDPTLVVGLEHVYVSKNTTFVVKNSNEEVQSSEKVVDETTKIANKPTEKTLTKTKKKQRKIIEVQEVKVAKQIITNYLNSASERKNLKQGWEKGKTLFSAPSSITFIENTYWNYKVKNLAKSNYRIVRSTIHPNFYSKFFINDIYSRPPPVNTFSSIFFLKNINL